MNCPSRTDKTDDHPDWNQNPSSLNADATTRADLNGIANSRERRSCLIHPGDQLEIIELDGQIDEAEETTLSNHPSSSEDKSPRDLDDHRRPGQRFPDARYRLHGLRKKLQHIAVRYAQL